jgi:exonuclease VII large subunit
VFEGSGSRQVRATALGRGTHGVPDVRRLVEAQFHVAFPHRVWVAGEVGRPAQADDGLRFPLRASTGEDPFWLPCVVPADGLAAVRDLLGRAHDADVEDVVREGRLARVGGLLRYDAMRGAVVLLVSELDPTPTALELVDARSAALAAVVDAGLVDAQRPLRMATAPLQVALVAPRGDAALVRVQEQLSAGPYDVDLDVHETDLTGPDAGARLADAVRAAGAGSDVVLAVRERGRPLGLASYDALEAAQAVAEAPVPVVAALGGEGTRTAFDEVAWASLPTAQEAMTWLLDRLADAEHRLTALAAELAHEAEDAGTRCRRALDEVRAETAAAAEQAATRSVEVRRRRRLQLRVACALVAVAVLVAALALDRPLLLLGLLAPVLALAAVELWWRSPARRSRTTHGPTTQNPTTQNPTTQSPTSTRSTMSRRDEDFTQVLSRLQAVRDELRTTTSPERVAVLRSLADELVADGERLLGVHLRAPVAAPPQASAELPAADADGARRAEPTRPVEEQVG